MKTGLFPVQSVERFLNMRIIWEYTEIKSIQTNHFFVAIVQQNFQAKRISETTCTIFINPMQKRNIHVVCVKKHLLRKASWRLTWVQCISKTRPTSVAMSVGGLIMMQAIEMPMKRGTMAHSTCPPWSCWRRGTPWTRPSRPSTMQAVPTIQTELCHLQQSHYLSVYSII